MAKNSKNALPKRIAGVKVPKAMRRGRFARFVRGELAGEIIASALVAGAVALARSKKGRTLTAKGKVKARKGADRLGAALTSASAMIADRANKSDGKAPAATRRKTAKRTPATAS